MPLLLHPAAVAVLARPGPTRAGTVGWPVDAGVPADGTVAGGLHGIIQPHAPTVRPPPVSGYHPAMATWIIVGGCLVLGLILGAAVLLVLLFTRGENDDDVSLPLLKRFTSRGSDGPPGPADSG